MQAETMFIILVRDFVFPISTMAKFVILQRVSGFNKDE